MEVSRKRPRTGVKIEDVEAKRAKTALADDLRKQFCLKPSTSSHGTSEDYFSTVNFPPHMGTMVPTSSKSYLGYYAPNYLDEGIFREFNANRIFKCNENPTGFIYFLIQNPDCAKRVAGSLSMHYKEGDRIDTFMERKNYDGRHPGFSSAAFMYKMRGIDDDDLDKFNTIMANEVDETWTPVPISFGPKTIASTELTLLDDEKDFALVQVYVRVAVSSSKPDHKGQYLSLFTGKKWFNSPFYQFIGVNLTACVTIPGDAEEDGSPVPDAEEEIFVVGHQSHALDISSMLAEGKSKTESVVEMFSLFWHAKNCDGKSGEDASFPCMCSAWPSAKRKKLLGFVNHFNTCKEPACKIPHCNLTRNFLQHFHLCEDKACDICNRICQAQKRTKLP